MAFHAGTEWDVRTTGNNANGGGFQVGSTGTDRSQSDAAYQAYTDIVIDHTTNTKITSAAHPFDATSVGNIINITGGGGFTVQRVQIVSQAAGVATCDKAVGTIDSTGGTGNLGGGLQTIAQAVALIVDGNSVHLKAGTYTITSAISSGLSLSWIGYGATHYDRGTKPLITTSTSSHNLLGVSWYTRVVNIAFSNTAATRWSGIYGVTTPTQIVICDCTFTGLNAVYMDAAGTRTVVDGCEIDVGGTTTHGIYSVGGLVVQNSYIHGCGAGAVYGILAGGTGKEVTIVRSIVSNCPTGISVASGSILNIVNSVVANNTGSGISITAACWLTVLNSIIYGNGAYGVTANSAISAFTRNVAFGANSTANRNNLGTGAAGSSTFLGDVALTADPFTDAAADDYSLNGAAGGGALCKAAGFQWGS